MRTIRNRLLGTWEYIGGDEKGISPSSSRDLKESDPGRILIVDDERRIRVATEVILADEMPLRVFDLAEDGEEAVRLFSAWHHRVIIMDLAMPVMDGETAYRHIAKICRDRSWQMPGIIFRTGYNPSPGIRAIVAQNPLHCLLRKPAGNQVLLMAVRERLDLA